MRTITWCYVQQLLFNAGYQTQDPNKRAAYLVRFAQMFPDSQYADQAMGVAAASYQQAQNAPKMLETANGLLAKDPNNIGMLLLIADYYSEKGEQLDKAEASAKKAITALDAAKKPDGVTDEQWQQQNGLQKGLALSALGAGQHTKEEQRGGRGQFQGGVATAKGRCGRLRAQSVPAGICIFESEEGAGGEGSVYRGGFGEQSVQGPGAG